MNERIIGIGLGLGKSYAFICVEWPGELVTVDDTEDTSVELNIDSNTEVLPGVGLNAAGLRNKVAFQENALWNSGILDTRLNDVQGSIF